MAANGPFRKADRHTAYALQPMDGLLAQCCSSRKVDGCLVCAAPERTNANHVGASTGIAASQMASALAYKSLRLAATTPPPPASLALPGGAESLPARPPNAAAASPDPRANIHVPIGSVPHVHTALIAAAEYRRRKAEEIVAAAQSAATKVRQVRTPKSAAKSAGKKAKTVAAASTGAATLIIGHKFEGREAGQAEKAVQAPPEADGVLQLAAEL